MDIVSKRVTKMKAIRMSLDTADQWERKGEPGWVDKCLSAALMNYLSIAVEQHSDLKNARAWLVQQEVVALLQRHRTNVEILASEVDAGRLPSSVIAGTFHLLTLGHLAWSLEALTLGEWFIALSQRRDVLELSTKFWREYARGIGCLVRREAYKAADLKLRGQEKYWMAYLRLVETATQRSTLSNALADIDKAFAARNGDKRIKDDNYETEGSGLHPIRWDYRRDSLMEYIGHMSQTDS